MTTNVRSIYTLVHEEIVQLARQQADAGEPMVHGFQEGTPQACAYERAYQERHRELFDQRAEV
jgi:hypothetical protein